VISLEIRRHNDGNHGVAARDFISSKTVNRNSGAMLGYGALCSPQIAEQKTF
jgi:hypothetical protein